MGKEGEVLKMLLSVSKCSSASAAVLGSENNEDDLDSKVKRDEANEDLFVGSEGGVSVYGSVSSKLCGF